MMENNWYVYLHIRLDKKEPFYVGIGNKKNYDRAYQTNPDRRNEILCKIFSKTKIVQKNNSKMLWLCIYVAISLKYLFIFYASCIECNYKFHRKEKGG